jgi:hypothetical protein
MKITTESIKNQRVLIKTWKQLKKEFGKNKYGDITTPSQSFVSAMKLLCGTIVELNEHARVIECPEQWNITPEMVQEIIPSCNEPEQPITK